MVELQVSEAHWIESGVLSRGLPSLRTGCESLRPNGLLTRWNVSWSRSLPATPPASTTSSTAAGDE